MRGTVVPARGAVIALLSLLLIVGSFVTGQTRASGRPGMTTSRTATVTAQDLIARLKELDTKIQAAITAAQGTKQKAPDFKQAGKDAGAAEAFKHNLIHDFFTDDEVYGLTYAYVYNELYCVDSHLVAAANDADATMPDAGKIAGDLKSAKTCLALFKAALEKANPAKDRDPAVTAILNKIGAVSEDIGKAETALGKKDFKAVRTHAADARSIKDGGIVQRYFDEALYGVTFSEFYRQLEGIDLALAGAETLAEGKNLDRFDKASIKSSLKLAKDLKEALLSTVTTAQETGFRDLGTPFGKGYFWLSDMASPVTTLDPTHMIGLGEATSTPVKIFVMGVSLLTGAKDTAIGNGTGMFAVSGNPLGVTDMGSKIDVWYSANGALDYSAFNLAGKVVGGSSVSEGDFSPLGVEMNQWPMGGNVVQFFHGVDGMTHNADLFTSTLSANNTLQSGPCPLASFPHTQGSITSVTPDAWGGFVFSTLMPDFIHAGVFQTNQTCGHATTPFVVGPNGYGAVPLVSAPPFAPSYDYFSMLYVEWTTTASNNDQWLKIDSLFNSGSDPVDKGFHFVGPRATQVIPAGFGVSGRDLMPVADVGGSLFLSFINAGSGKLDTRIPVNPFLFLPPGRNQYAVPTDVDPFPGGRAQPPGTGILFNTPSGASVGEVGGVM